VTLMSAVWGCSRVNKDVRWYASGCSGSEDFE
jgi:hypothetical protein